MLQNPWLEHDFACLETDHYAGMEENGWCHSMEMILVYASLATIDGFIALAAAIQLLRLYVHNRHASWTRQKVIHCMICASNFGYFLYFILNPIATCRRWKCWSTLWGFVVSAAPDIVFLTTFLLLLSFWVDLCHQATDHEEEEEDEENCEQISVHSHTSKPSSHHHTWCIPLRRIRGRQRLVILMVMGMCLLTAAFTGLIWYGMGDNNIDSVTMAKVYADFFAIVVLLSGGGLAAYGLLLYNKMCRVKTSKASADIHKVAGLAVASVVCFSLRAFVVLFFDNPFINIWDLEHVKSQLHPLLTFLYYVIGEAIPSIVVLWVMRDMPPRSRDPSLHGCPVLDDSIETGLEQALIPDTGHMPQWIVSPSGRQYLVVPVLPSNDITRQKSEAVKDSTG
ncbi:hypothetical protein BDL97_11G099600 [Sphagnum fallax]|nr:hypothetical protein BDL97_11G099600 [Sphagnum fallax]